MVKNIFFQIFSMLYFATFGQQAQLSRVGYVPDVAHECSGMALLPSGHLAMINDSGNEPVVYITTHQGKLLQSIHLPHVTNTDWEEIEYANGHLYIGDFGNNKNNRQDLSILKYKINERDSLYGKEVIHFRYARQQHFPPAKDQKNYDMEAMVYFNDSLFLFSKNRTKPFSGYTYLYGMPAKAGHYTIAPLDSFKTGVGDKKSWWVAGAALSPDKKRLVLLGYDKMWVFENFKGSRFFGGTHHTLSLGLLTQKESVTFINNAELLITDELNPTGGGNIYHTQLAEDDDLHIEVVPKRFDTSIILQMNKAPASQVYYEIIDTRGKQVTAGKVPYGKTRHTIDTQALPAGGYVLHLLMGSRPYRAYKLKKLYAKNDR